MGNPNRDSQNRFTTERPESLSAKLTMRIAPSMMEKLKSKKDWRELVRIAIAEKLEELEQEEYKAS